MTKKEYLNIVTKCEKCPHIKCDSYFNMNLGFMEHCNKAGKAQAIKDIKEDRK